MMPWGYRLRLGLLGKRVTVPIARCVHYGAFRYGHAEPHPYEGYTRELARGNRCGARAWFVEFLQHYRPRTFGEAVGAELEGKHGLWHFPWLKHRPDDDGWWDDPLGFPDIVTQFCDEGILWFRIEQEFFWLERSFYSIRRNGYKPGRAAGVVGWRFVRTDGTETFLLLDGNHRVSALAALGHAAVELAYLPHHTVSERDLLRWPQVTAGTFSPKDAAAVFRAYFDGNRAWRTAAEPARLLERPE
jgi:hypothetical protein